MDTHTGFMLIVFSSCFGLCLAQSCDEDEILGPVNVVEYNDDFDEDRGYGYVLYDHPFIVDCCGAITNWQFSVGDTGDIQLQVWRPKRDNMKHFELLGYNKYEVGRRDRKAGFITLDVIAGGELLVEPGDVLGWYAPGDSLIDYKRGTGYSGIWKIQHKDSMEIGTVVDFSDGASQEDRTYGIQAKISTNKPPTFAELKDTTISMETEVGTAVFVVEVTDSDPGDSSLTVELTSDSEFFEFDPSTNIVSVGKELSVPERGETYTLEFKVIDRCGVEVTDTLAITVEYVADTTTASSTTEPTTDTGTTDDYDDDNDDTTTFTATMITFTTERRRTQAPFTRAPQPIVKPVQSRGEKKKTGGGIIAGVVVSIIFVTVVAVLVIIIFHKRYQERQVSPKRLEESIQSKGANPGQTEPTTKGDNNKETKQTKGGNGESKPDNGADDDVDKTLKVVD